MSAIELAAANLSYTLSSQPWLQTVGFCIDKLIVYTYDVRAALAVLPASWEGYPVEVTEVPRGKDA